jgi:ADP-heptose:LPS heptosyltransferase
MKPVFLISHRGALGDFLLTWPLIIALRFKYSEHRFVGLGHPEYLAFAKSLNIFDEIYDCESRQFLSFYSGKTLPKILNPLECVLAWSSDGDGLATFLTKEKVNNVCVFKPFPEVSGQHVMDYHLSLLSKYSLPPVQNKLLVLPIQSENEDHAVIHPGSGSSSKNYEPEFYAFIGNELKNKGIKEVKILLGPNERGLKDIYKKRFTVIEPKNVSDLAKIIVKSSLFVGNDSGVSHLAAMLGVRTLALFKSTDPAQWGVRGIKAESIQASTEAQAMARIQKAIEHN